MSIGTNNNRPSLQSAIDRKVYDSVDARPSLTKLSVIFGQVTAIEFIIVATSTYIASICYHYSSLGSFLFSKEYVNAALFIATIFTIFSLGFRHFEMAQRRQLHLLLWSGLGAVTLSFVLFLSTIFLLKISADYSRGAFIVQIIGVSIVVCLFRTLLLLWLQAAVASGVIEARRAVLVGTTDPAITAELRTNGIHVVHSISLPYDHYSSGASGDLQVPSDSNARKLVDVCRLMHPDDVIILAGQKDLPLASNLAYYFSELPCDTHIVPLDEVRFLARSQIAELGSLRTLQVSRKPLSSAELVIKRIFDLVIAISAIIVLSPLLAVVAIAIKLDSHGNVLFRQMRHGYNNQVIRVFKFRTMKMTKSSDSAEFVPVTENDDRVTTVGQILRRTSIDELPQLFNVIMGEMSIVGPRPHATDHNAMFKDQILPFARRHNVKPGITGWAQVNGYRGPANTIEQMRLRVDCDLYYIDNWSFLFDLKIILMTLFSKKTYKNAF